MDIKIEAPGHSRQQQLIDFYSIMLNRHYSAYPFIVAIDVKVKLVENDDSHVALTIKPEKGKMLYVSDTHKSEHRALKEAIRKMNVHIEKYKAVHYHTHHGHKS